MFGDGSSRVFGLPPGVDFATELARGVLSRMAGQPPEALARVQIYTNARRAARASKMCFRRRGR